MPDVKPDPGQSRLEAPLEGVGAMKRATSLRDVEQEGLGLLGCLAGAYFCGNACRRKVAFQYPAWGLLIGGVLTRNIHLV
jgi:hypothetical protein